MSDDDDNDFERQWAEQSRLHPIDDEAWKKMPIFMENITEKDVLENSDVACLSNILHEETNPIELANRLKSSGNNNLKLSLQTNNKHLISSAIEFYTQALEVRCDDVLLNSVLYSNRSQAHLFRENFGCALADAEKSMSLDPCNLKAHYRASIALLKLRKYAECLVSIQKLNEKISEDDRLKKLVCDLEAKAKLDLKRIDDQCVKKLNRIKQQEKEREDVIQLVSNLGIRQGPIEMNLDDFSEVSGLFPKRISRDDGSETIQIPIVVAYDSHSQTDLIESTDWETTVLENLEMLLEELPQWDTHQEYACADKLRVFFFSSVDQSYCEIHSTLTLKEMLLMYNYALPGVIPIIHVLPEGCGLIDEWGAQRGKF